MRLTKSGFLPVFLLITLLAGSACFAADTEPANRCLTIPEISHGQGAATGYQPGSCVAAAEGMKSDFLSDNSVYTLGP
jgi:hypothetical protein